MAAHDPMKIRPELVHKVSFMVWNVVFDEEEQMFTSGVVLIFDLDGFSVDHFMGMPIALAVKIAPCWEVSVAHQVNENCIKLDDHFRMLIRFARRA